MRHIKIGFKTPKKILGSNNYLPDTINIYTIKELLNLNDYNDIKIMVFDSGYTLNFGFNTLPELPESLVLLDCNFNNIKELPKLPNTLLYLNCDYNNLSQLPELPPKLMWL